MGEESSSSVDETSCKKQSMYDFKGGSDVFCLFSKGRYSDSPPYENSISFGKIVMMFHKVHRKHKLSCMCLRSGV
jgi:hypothetical protein